MDEGTEIRCEIDLTFQEHLHEIGLFCLIGGGSGIDILKKLVASYFNSGGKLKIPRILITGAASSGKRTVAHAFINSLAIERVTFVEGKYIDSPGFSISSKCVFENGVDKAVIIGHIENLRSCESVIWQYLTFRKCYYHNFKNDSEICHYDGLIILTASKKELISKEILKNIDVAVELAPYEPHQIRKILEQRLKYMQIGYNDKSFNLLINSCDNKAGKLMQILKLCIIRKMSYHRNYFKLKDIEWALDHCKS